MITKIGLDYFRELPYTNNYLLFLCAIFFFEHGTAIMSGNCAMNFHRYHFNKILVVFRCFGEIKKFYGLSGIFTGPLRVFLGILWYSWVNVWTDVKVCIISTVIIFKVHVVISKRVTNNHSKSSKKYYWNFHFKQLTMIFYF